MAKFYGKVGYLITYEERQDVWSESIDEKSYYGDVIRNIKRTANGEGSINDNIRFNNQISIVADEFAYNNFSNIKYVEWMGSKLKVETVTVEHPRLILEVGGVYNGPNDTSGS